VENLRIDREGGLRERFEQFFKKLGFDADPHRDEFTFGSG